MTRISTPPDLPPLNEWFSAATRWDTARLGQLLDEGGDVNAVDDAGRTALFYALSPAGGDPATVRWMLQRGADPTIRDQRGRTAVEYGREHVCSGLESSTLYECARLCEGATRARADFAGWWTVSSGPHAGRRIRVEDRRVSGEIAPLRLTITHAELTEHGVLHLDGEHAGALVHAVLRLDGTDTLQLSWNDGATFPLELSLSRTPVGR